MADDQSYYWTPQWQTEERETVDALERGEGITFPDALAAIEWLTSEER